MNTHILLLFPVIIVSLVGCNTLATKPSSGREKLSQQQILEGVADNNSTKNWSSVDSTYRIETEPTELAWAFFDKPLPLSRVTCSLLHGRLLTNHPNQL